MTFISTSTHAAVLLYEGFDYSDLSNGDSINGKSGGTWDNPTDAWDGGNLQYQTTGLSHANVSTTGGATLVTNSFQSDRPWDLTAIPGTSSSASYWGYFLFNPNGNDMSGGDRVRLWSDGSSGDGLGVEFSGTSARAFVEAGPNDSSGSDVDFVDNTATHMVLFHVQFDPTNDDTIRIWLNPAGSSTAPSLASADSIASAAAADDKSGLYLRDNNSGTENLFTFDEFKLANNYEDLGVIPEPSAAMLLLSGLGAFLLLRRRR